MTAYLSSSVKRGGGHARHAPQRWPEQPLLSCLSVLQPPEDELAWGLSDQQNEDDMMW